MGVSTEELFAQHFGVQPEVTVHGPGRIEVLGNHTDYNEGFVLSKTVSQRVSASLAKIDAPEVRVMSTIDPNNERVIQLNSLDEVRAKGDCLVYVQGILLEISKRFDIPCGALIAVESDVPASAGMSSSAAFEVAIISGLDGLFGIGLEPMEKARIGQLTENLYTGAKTGLMDQLTSVCGKPGHLLYSEYRNVSFDHVPFNDRYSFVVVNSGVKHDLSQEYNERREQCEEVVAILSKSNEGIKALRDVDRAILEENKASLPEVSYRRALHVVVENERVAKASEFLSAGDMRSFGALLFESHQSSIDCFENSCLELDQMVEIAKASDQCLGARLSGGGFGGVAICLVAKENEAAFAQEMQEAMKVNHGLDVDIFFS